MAPVLCHTKEEAEAFILGLVRDEGMRLYRLVRVSSRGFGIFRHKAGCWERRQEDGSWRPSGLYRNKYLE